MKIYACYSKSHAPLVEEYFTSSVPSGFELVLREVHQYCPSGTYGKEGWQEAMCAKLEMIQKAITTEDESFIACDVDILFHRLTVEDVTLKNGLDVAYALDFPLAKRGVPQYCAGFAVIRPSPRTRVLYDLLLRFTRLLGSEQQALNREVLPALSSLVAFDYLPPDRFWSLPHPLPVSYDLAVCHASWVHGVDAKLGFLDAVKNLLETFPCS